MAKRDKPESESDELQAENAGRGPKRGEAFHLDRVEETIDGRRVRLVVDGKYPGAQISLTQISD